MGIRSLALATTLAAGAALALVGCGISVTSQGATVTPTPQPTAAPTRPLPTVSASGAGPAAPSASPRPMLTPAAEAAAARKAAAAADVKAILPRFDEEAARIFADSRVPGAAVAVVAGDRAVYVRCFGIREVGKPDEVDKDTVFQLAAISQGFTATAMAALVGEREIAWDDPVQRYWPGFKLWDPWVSRRATLRDLMSNRSGLPDYAGEELKQFGYGRMEILRRLRYLKPAAGFRAAFAFQNALPTAAAVGVSGATGESWAKLVRTRVLEPLGMDSTVLSYSEYVAEPDRSSSHALVNGVMTALPPYDDDVFAPSGAVGSSIADLVLYLRLHLNDGALAGIRVAGKQALDATHTGTTAMGQDDQGPSAYALGWETRSFDGRLVVRRSGDFSRGSSSMITMVPADGVGIVVLGNAFPEGQALANALTDTLVDLYTLGAPQRDWLAEQQALGTAVGDSTADRLRRLPTLPPLGAVPPRARSVYAGAYANRYYGRIIVRPGAGVGLDVTLGRGDTVRYVPWNGDTWRQPDTDTAAVFTVRDGRSVSVKVMMLHYLGRNGVFVRSR